MSGQTSRGVFITLEGGEGSGKSTVIQTLASHLHEAGHDALVTQEPEGTDLGRHIWAYFRELAAAGSRVTAEAELFLFAAARAEHVRTVIAPALDAGRIVLCDRFADSTTAYQGHGRGLDIATVQAVNRTAIAGCEPDLTLLLDVPAEKGLRRARALETDASKRPDAIGAESRAFHDRVRAGFLTIAAANQKRMLVIDATQPLVDVCKQAIVLVGAYLNSRS
ncbi:MAG: dTMP kinase [Dehalococcoidia bacterium]